MIQFYVVSDMRVSFISQILMLLSYNCITVTMLKADEAIIGNNEFHHWLLSQKSVGLSKLLNFKKLPGLLERDCYAQYH